MLVLELQIVFDAIWWQFEGNENKLPLFEVWTTMFNGYFMTRYYWLKPRHIYHRHSGYVYKINLCTLLPRRHLPTNTHSHITIDLFGVGYAVNYPSARVLSNIYMYTYTAAFSVAAAALLLGNFFPRYWIANKRWSSTRSELSQNA